MSILIFLAYWNLMYFDLYLARRNFAIVSEKVRSCPVGRPSATADTTQKICDAVDVACIWYWKEVLCLQRSVATVSLLKRYGVSAHMMIGVQQTPFKAHAWIEVDGRVVSDKAYMREIYAVLDQW